MSPLEETNSLEELDRRTAVLETRQRTRDEANEAVQEDLRMRLEKLGRMTATQLDVMMVRDRVEHLAAVSTDTRECMHRIEKKTREHDARFDAVDARFDGMDRRFEAVDRRFDAMEQAMEQCFAAVGRRFDAVDRRLDAMDGRLEAVDGLDRKVTELQAGVGRVLELMEEARA